MKVLVAGATGAIGRALVPVLVAAGHEVTGLSRAAGPVGKEARLAGEAGSLRIRAVDALDRQAVAAAIREAAPEAVVNMLTAIPATIHPKRMAAEFAQTNRLRTEGTRNLVDAATRTGVRRVIAQGLAYPYDPARPGIARESEPLWPRPPRQFARAAAALRELQERTTEAGGTVLRLGHLYGPGTVYAADGSSTAAVRAGRLPLVGAGTSVFSFIHVHDVATAVLAAVEHDGPDVLNIVDDDPAPVREWLPFLATVLGAPAPKRVPAALARIAVGGWGTAYMTRLRGADNARARLVLHWRPRYGSWRDGFAHELAGATGQRPPAETAAADSRG